MKEVTNNMVEGTIVMNGQRKLSRNCRLPTVIIASLYMLKNNKKKE